MTLDPAFAQSGNELTIVNLAYETLIRPVITRDGNPAFNSGVARSWHSNGGGDVWTFHLGERRFANGEPITAAVVKQSLEGLRASGGFAAARLGCIRSVHALGPRTLRIDLAQPSATLLHELSSTYAAIVPEAVLCARRSGHSAQLTAGSGPFQVKRFDETCLIMAANPMWDGLVGDEEVAFPFIVDSDERTNMLERGDIDVAENLSLEHLGRLRHSDDIIVVDGPSLLLTYMVLNCRSKILCDQQSRRDLATGLDYAELIDVFGVGATTALDSLVPTGISPAFGSTRGIANADTGSHLLGGSGFSLRGKRLRFLVDYPGDQSYWSDVVRLASARLRSRGVNVEIDRVQFNEMRRRLNDGEFDVAVVDWALDYSDPGAVLNYWLHSRHCGLAGNLAFYTNAAVDSALDRADRLPCGQVREHALSEAEKSALSDSPYIPLVQRHFHFACRRYAQTVIRSDGLGWQGLNTAGVVNFLQPGAR